jgi:hypothetical protein
MNNSNFFISTARYSYVEPRRVLSPASALQPLHQQHDIAAPLADQRVRSIFHARHRGGPRLNDLVAFLESQAASSSCSARTPASDDGINKNTRFDEDSFDFPVRLKLIFVPSAQEIDSDTARIYDGRFGFVVSRAAAHCC